MIQYHLVDNQDDLDQFQTQIYNVSYDLEATDTHIYATSFAGGVRRFNFLDDNPNWELVPLPMDNQQQLLCGQIDIETYKYDPVEIAISLYTFKLLTETVLAYNVAISNAPVTVTSPETFNSSVVKTPTEREFDKIT